MREKERIERICNTLKELWLENPDWRFGQLLINYALAKDNYSVWSIEDDVIEKHLNGLLEELQKRSHNGD